MLGLWDRFAVAKHMVDKKARSVGFFGTVCPGMS